jgi:hypothetical protein
VCECWSGHSPGRAGSLLHGQYNGLRPRAQAGDAEHLYVRSATVSWCPVCAGGFSVIGSRPRTRRTPTGDRHVLVIRCLRCTACDRTHHELPACLVPYKRYDTESWEAVATHGRAAAVEEGTLRRCWTWFTTDAPERRPTWADRGPTPCGRFKPRGSQAAWPNHRCGERRGTAPHLRRCAVLSR